MTLVYKKYTNFTRFIYDALTLVWKLLFEKYLFSGTFCHLVASNKSKLQRAGPNRT